MFTCLLTPARMKNVRLCLIFFSRILANKSVQFPYALSPSLDLPMRNAQVYVQVIFKM